MASLFLSSASMSATRRVSLPSGSVIPVRLDQDLNSQTARTGSRITATVLSGKNDAGIPEGSRIQGVVRESLRAEDGQPGVLDLDFRRLVTPGGQDRPFTGSLIALDSKNVQSSLSGRMVAKNNRNQDRMKFVGIGAGAGLLIGTLTKKGNKLTDTLLGAGAGYLYDQMNNKKKTSDVNLKAGTEFGIRLDRPFTFDTNRDEPYQSASYDEIYRPTPNDDLSNEGSNSSGSSERYKHWASLRERRSGAASHRSANDIGMSIDDRNVPFTSAKPFMRSNQTLVPMDAVSQAAGFDYYYDPQKKMILCGRNGSLRLGLNSRTAMRGSKPYRMPVASEIRNGTLYVPVQFIGLATDGSTAWDSASRTILLTTGREANAPIYSQ
jgi:hypothetical protein